MYNEQYILSLWPLTDEGEFVDAAPAWESASLELPEAEAAYNELTHAVAWAITGDYYATYNLSLDKLDEDGIGVCCQMRSLEYAAAPTPRTEGA